MTHNGIDGKAVTRLLSVMLPRREAATHVAIVGGWEGAADREPGASGIVVNRTPVDTIQAQLNQVGVLRFEELTSG